MAAGDCAHRLYNFTGIGEYIGWQEAIARLAYERTRAESCVKALKAYGKKDAIKRGEIGYDQAKAEYDGIIRGLAVALARKGEPTSLPDLEVRTQRGFEARWHSALAFSHLCRPAPAERGPIADMAGGAVGPVVDAAKAIWVRVRDDDALMRKTIENQLEATLWQRFKSLSSLLPILLSTGAAGAGPAGPSGAIRPPGAGGRSRYAYGSDLACSADRNGRWAVTGRTTRRYGCGRCPKVSSSGPSACQPDPAASVRFTRSR